MTVETMTNLLERASAVLAPNYGNRQVAIVSGEGARCRDSEGREYIDFLSGIAVNALGHCDPEVTAAIAAQAAKLTHCSNVFVIEPQVELAERLVAASGLDKVFFANSGAEATEGAIKLARLAALKTKGPGHHRILSFRGSFHGRTYAAMSATASPKVRQGFDPLCEGFEFADLNDLSSVDSVLDDSFAAVLVETVQGEGGIVPCTAEFLAGLRERCDRVGAALILDEIQCGMGRTARAFAFQHFSVRPDIVPLAKALGGGLPLGAILMTDKYAQHLVQGTHGTTFGGNPVACAAGLVVCKRVFDPGFLKEVGAKGNALWGVLEDLRREHPDLVERVRGLGLMQGLVLTIPGMEVVGIARNHGLLINCTAERVLRFLPPLGISMEDIEEGASRLRVAFAEFAAKSREAILQQAGS
jgi:acetylornithine/N-succinyldiaminopimelate aminotransferase